MRYVSAYSSGSTGAALVAALEEAGLQAHLLGSPEALLRAERTDEAYGSTRDLMARMERWVRAHPEGAVVHAAAVGDYEVADAGDAKIPSGRDALQITLTPTPKIADHVRGWGLTGPYVTFKAASPETSDDALVALARRQRERTGSDRVFANVLGRIGSRVALVGADVTWFEARDAGIAALVAWLAAA